MPELDDVTSPERTPAFGIITQTIQISEAAYAKDRVVVVRTPIEP